MLLLNEFTDVPGRGYLQGRGSAHGPGWAPLQTLRKPIGENLTRGFTESISLPGVLPAAFARAGGGGGFSRVLSIACGLLLQQSNALIRTQCLKQLKGHWFQLHAQALGNARAALEPFRDTKNVLSKRLGTTFLHAVLLITGQSLNCAKETSKNLPKELAQVSRQRGNNSPTPSSNTRN